jgi:hypothetical protein
LFCLNYFLSRCRPADSEAKHPKHRAIDWHRLKHSVSVCFCLQFYVRLGLKHSKEPDFFSIQITPTIKRSNPAAEPHGSPQGCTVRPRKSAGQISMGAGMGGYLAWKRGWKWGPSSQKNKMAGSKRVSDRINL